MKDSERERLQRSLAKAEDAAFKNLVSFLKQREITERLARALPKSEGKRPR